MRVWAKALIVLNCQVNVTVGAFLAGFGKGKFKEEQADNKESHDILFQILRGSTLIMLDGNIITATEALKQKRKTSPQAGAAYHTIKQEPAGQDQHFEFEVVAWLLNDVLICQHYSCL